MTNKNLELLAQPYEAKNFEDKIYQKWEASGYFNPDKMIADGLVAESAPNFTMVLPPPNVTGTLHMGHACMVVIEDIMTRFHRMSGYKSLWIPGTDSAALATQEKVEKELYKKEGKRRQDLGREEFLKRVSAFTQESHDTIVNQVRKMGSSLDWTREAYTLDDARNYAVNEAFARMFKTSLIEKGDYIVNWDPKMQTTVSDDELEYEEEKTTLYYFKYGPFTIATARPETKFGDKFVVMHPADTRYTEYSHGQQIDLEWINGKVTATIIKDEVIDMDFGTGVMTITPWHDVTDFELAKKHGLPYEQIIDFYGKMLPTAGERFAGLKIEEARKQAVEILREKGLVVKEEPYTHNIAVSSRGGGKIEPQIKSQWFVRVNKEFKMGPSKIDSIKEGDTVTLKKLMQTVVRSGQIKILPNTFDKTYFQWIDNLRDWCISRQIWFGHRIPVWYRGEEVWCGHGAPDGTGWTQDEDTLDTWFSSSLWTFSTLGWPNNIDEVKRFHPTSVLETGYDIIFFWVARMILSSTFLLGEIPFETVYLHGLVRDKNGKKMSKSLGNIIDPLDMTALYGTDAVRMSLIVGNPPGADLNFSEDKVRAYKKFANKLWNISRFVLKETENLEAKSKLTTEDEALLAEWQATLGAITKDIKDNKFYLAAENLYHYSWHRFADQIIEESKKVLQDENATTESKVSKQTLLLALLEEQLKALHPFMPFITETIWTEVMGQDQLLMVSAWPK